MTAEQNQTDPTRERLLDEAERLFAEKGFHAVSVREITSAAGAHLSAVNYHFGSKKGLYLEVFRSRWLPRARRIDARLAELEARDNPSPTDLVGVIADAFFSSFEDEEERRRHHQLIHREISSPTEAFQIIVQEVTKPFSQRVAGLLRPWLPPDLSQEDIFLHIFSIFSQILFFSFGRPMVSQITGREYNQSLKERLVRHITSFSVGGLRAAREARHEA
jgi:AcrR family transcriptional regulator